MVEAAVAKRPEFIKSQQSGDPSLVLRFHAKGRSDTCSRDTLKYLNCDCCQRFMTVLIYKLYPKNTKLTLNFSMLKVLFLKQDLNFISQCIF